MENKQLSYISLFSAAGIGCYGFKKNGYNCIATLELLEKRLKIQKINNICDNEKGYISGDIRNDSNKEKLFNAIEFAKSNKKIDEIDVLLATPPCQGMSVANHKKNDEKNRNSLVVESIKLTKVIRPKFFIFENVRSFFKTICTDIDGKDKTIKESIEINLESEYNILFEIVNFINFGSNSSRTRALVIGIRKDLLNISPYDIFPEKVVPKTLREIIGDFKPLKHMGEIDPDDIFHSFRPYKNYMLDWIKDLKEGESAFDNKHISKVPHQIKNDTVIINVNKNGDKYTRNYWDKPAPCVHTRNDILSSQNTIHPRDNRVFSIRELMKLMTIPDEFKWIDRDLLELNKLNNDEKVKILKKEEMNIRHSIGEAVPTNIFSNIAIKIKSYLLKNNLNAIQRNSSIEKVGTNSTLFICDELLAPYGNKLKEYQQKNINKDLHAAYYTRQDVCYSIIKDLPPAEKFNVLNIIEPSIGIGSFLPLLIKKYDSVPSVIIDAIDIDQKALDVAKSLMRKIEIPKNFKINFICDDFLKFETKKKYDLLIGNPPFKKILKNKSLLKIYKKDVQNKQSSNLFAFFIEKALKISKNVALIVPKSLMNAPEYNITRNVLKQFKFKKICDYGESAFDDVLIETISFIVETKPVDNNNVIKIESYIDKSISFKRQEYVMKSDTPSWLLYRNKFFDNVMHKLDLNIFKVFRDRQITKKITKKIGHYRVLKSRNLSDNKIINLKGYDTYIDEINKLNVKKYLNNPDAVLIPNLTYNQRAVFMPKNSIADGSVAILTLVNGYRKITSKDLSFYSSQEFKEFYRIARNFSSRSMNIDSNSVFYFGAKKGS